MYVRNYNSTLNFLSDFEFFLRFFLKEYLRRGHRRFEGSRGYLRISARRRREIRRIFPSALPARKPSREYLILPTSELFPRHASTATTRLCAWWVRICSKYLLQFRPVTGERVRPYTYASSLYSSIRMSPTRGPRLSPRTLGVPIQITTGFGTVILITVMIADLFFFIPIKR